MGYLIWAVIIVLAWYAATHDARRTRQDRADVKRVRAAQRRVLR